LRTGGGALMGDKETLYVWPTPLTPHALVSLCPSVQMRGGFFAPAEVVVFPEAVVSSGYTVMSTEAYLETGQDLHVTASAVRINVGSPGKNEPFSLIWTPLPGHSEAKGLAHVVARPGALPIMEDMISQSATSETDARTVIREAQDLNGPRVPSMLRPPSEAGLVKSLSIPASNLRLISRLSDELLKRDATIVHEVVIAAAVPEAVENAQGLRCEVSVFPRGLVRITSAPAGAQHTVVGPVEPEWGRPPEGRTGIGSRYVLEGLVSRNEFVVDAPSIDGGVRTGRLGSVVRARVRLLRGNEEVCRLNHLFELEHHDTASPFAEVVQHVIEAGRLTDLDVAQATGVAVETVRAWLRDDEEPAGIETARLNELSGIVERLADVIDADFIPLWLRKPLRVLGDQKPLDLLARGDYRKISRMVAGLESPVAS
jgi:hypothetical protein